MSAIETPRPLPLGAITTFRLVSTFERAYEAFNAWQNTRATAQALGKLSDAQLADIGLLRGNITELAEDLARR